MKYVIETLVVLIVLVAVGIVLLKLGIIGSSPAQEALQGEAEDVSLDEQNEAPIESSE